MHKEHGIVLGAGALQEMLAASVHRKKKRRRNKSFPVTLSFDSKARELFVEEARHGLSGYRIPAVGGWPEKVQVDGTVLKRMCDTFQQDDIVKLVPLRQAAVVEPVDPFESGHLDGFEAAPRAASMDHLGLVEAVDGLGQRVVVGIADTAD